MTSMDYGMTLGVSGKVRAPRFYLVTYMFYPIPKQPLILHKELTINWYTLMPDVLLLFWLLGDRHFWHVFLVEQT